MRKQILLQCEVKVKEPVVHKSFLYLVGYERSHCTLEEDRVLHLQKHVQFVRAILRVVFRLLFRSECSPFEE